MTEREWTAQQLAIFEDVEVGDSNLCVIARAGSGKTTTIEEAILGLVALDPKASVIYLAFSREVAAQAKKRMRHRNLDIATCHSFGYRALRESLGALDVDRDRTLNLATSLVGRKGDRFTLAKAAGLAKGSLVTDMDELEDLLDEYGLEYEADKGMPQIQLANDTLDLLEQCRDVSDGAVDHDDQIWLPTVLADIDIPTYDYVFVDEAQDLNPAQIELVMKAVKSDGRIITVGDPAQSIYQFRGADKHAIPNIIARTESHTLPLSVTFRCPVKVVEEARRYVKDIQPRKDAEQGTVRTVVDRKQLLKEAEYGDFILSRTNAPLIGLALELVADECRTMILGREIGAGLVSLIYKLKARDVADLRLKVVKWAEKKATRLLNKEPPQYGAADLVNDSRDCIMLLANKARNVDEVAQRARDLFEVKDRKSCVVLATTHKAKGLEADTVWLLRDTYLQPWGNKQEEVNLLYVAITRAKKELVYVKEKQE